MQKKKTVSKKKTAKKTISKKKVVSKSVQRRVSIQMNEEINKVAQFTFKEIEVNLVFRNGMIGYTFEKDGKTFGQKVKPEGESPFQVACATFLVLQNFVETLEAVQLIKE